MGESKILVPTRSYNITLKIKGEEYSNDLTNVKISSSLATGYQIIVLTIRLTPETIVLNKLYGQDSISLSISLLDQSEFSYPSLDFNLMILNSEFEIPMSEGSINNNQNPDRSNFSIITVTREPFQIMSSNAGCLFGDKSTKFKGGQTVRQMIEAMVSEFAPKAKLEYDVEKENSDLIRQCCIPPTPLYKAIKLLDSNHGIYFGASAIFCQFDNTIQIMNLSTRIKNNYTIYVEHLTTDAAKKDIETAGVDIKKFYTYDNLYTNYVGNSKFGVLGSTLKHIVLPSNQLSHIITQELADVCKKNGVVGSDTKESTYIDSIAVKRTTYYIENNGNDTSECHAYSNISKKIADLSRLNFSVERSLHIENLLKIGSVVKVGTKAINHIDLGGKYILFSSDINWNKSGEWQTTANLELIRTNKTI